MLALSETMVSSKPKAVFGMGLILFKFRTVLQLSPSNRANYIAIPLYICGFVTLGAAFQKHLSVGALIMGWGIAEMSIMISTVSAYAYCSDAFPKHQVCKILQAVLNFP